MTSLSDLKLRTVSLVSIAISYCGTHQGLLRFNLLLYRAAWLGNWNTIFKRFQHWVKRDVLKHILDAVSKGPDMQYAMIDDTIVKAHRHGQGVKWGSKPGHRPLARTNFKAEPKQTW